jgi:hypothetical protein
MVALFPYRILVISVELVIREAKLFTSHHPRPVAFRKDDAPAADQAAMANLAGLMSFSGGGGLIQTTPG